MKRTYSKIITITALALLSVLTLSACGGIYDSMVQELYTTLADAESLTCEIYMNYKITFSANDIPETQEMSMNIYMETEGNILYYKVGYSGLSGTLDSLGTMEMYAVTTEDSVLIYTASGNSWEKTTLPLDDEYENQTDEYIYADFFNYSGFKYEAGKYVLQEEKIITGAMLENLFGAVSDFFPEDFEMFIKVTELVIDPSGNNIIITARMFMETVIENIPTKMECSFEAKYTKINKTTVALPE